jgi:hypothetical protein
MAPLSGFHFAPALPFVLAHVAALISGGLASVILR